MKVLITGGLGYIGSHTAVELSSRGYECFIMDNLMNSNRTVFNRIDKLSEYPVTLMVVDLFDSQGLAEVFKRYKFDAVIHFAGLKAVGESVGNPLQYYEHNLISTLNLLKEMKKANVKNLVFSSSATVYGDLTVPPVSEDAPTSILNPYGRTKLMIEEMLQDLALSDSEWSIALLRYFNPIGAHPSGLIGENLNGTPNNLMPYIMQVANGKRDYLNIFGDDYSTPDGTGVRDYIHVMDLAKGHFKALEFLENHTGVHTFNLGTGNGYSVLDLVKTFEEVNNVHIPYRIVDRRSGDIAVSYADASKAERELGWKAELGLTEMCEDAWRWEQSQNNDFLKM